MPSLLTVSVWVVITVLTAGPVNDFVQTMMVDVGLISKPIGIEDICKMEILPRSFERALGCPTKAQKIINKVSDAALPKLTLGGDIMKKYKFETREKTMSEKIADGLNSVLVYAQRLVLPEDYVMPCLVGDCDMDKQIQKEKKEYENMMFKKESTDSSHKHEPDMPSRTPDMPSRTPDMPSRTPDMPSRTPDMPSRTPNKPSRTPDKPAPKKNKKV